MRKIIVWACLVTVVTVAQVTPPAVTTEESADNEVTDSAQLSDHRLVNHTVRVLQPVSSLVVCGQKCASHGGCRSLNYLPTGGVCELNGASRLDFPEDLRVETGGDGVVYLGRGSPLINIDQPATCPCCDNACQNDAYCVTSAESTRAYKCVCSSGWAGEDCELRIASWSGWSAWDPCFTTCGPGARTRTRICAGDVHSPDSCRGDEVEHRSCWNSEPCPEWSQWTDVGTCSAAAWCGRGTVNRTRVCSGNQTDCEGAPTRTTKCRSVLCEAPWRLVGGTRRGEGRLEVYSNVHGEWGTVCFDGWDRWDTDVACRTLGLLPPPTYMDPGYENMCDDDWTSYRGFCYWGSGAGLNLKFEQAEDYCQVYAAHSVSILTAEENEFVRSTYSVVDKIWTGAHNGILEGGSFGTSMVWSDDSDPGYREDEMQDAVTQGDRWRCLAMGSNGNWDSTQCTRKRQIVCKKYPHFSLQFGQGSGAIHLSDMQCRGCEGHLKDCRHGNWHDVSSCGHAQDVGLKCSFACPAYETDASTVARFPFPPDSSGSLAVDFTVKTSGTVNLVLSSTEDVAGSIYSITLSASEASSIHRHSTDSLHDVSGNPAISDAGAVQGFWLSLSGDTLSVGRAAEGAPLLDWTDELGSASAAGALYVGFDSDQRAEWQFASFCN